MNVGSWYSLHSLLLFIQTQSGLISIVYFCLPQNEKSFGGGNFGGGFGGSTKYNRKKLAFCRNIYHFRVFYLESASPELKEYSIIMKIGFKFAKIEYFQNLQESVENISLPFKYGSLKSPGE